MSLTVMGYPNTRSLRAVWALEELALDYEYQLIDFMKGESRSEDYLSVNAGGKVPALKTESGVITESMAIVNYIAALKPDAELIPTSSLYRRAMYDQWAAFAISELEQPMWTISKCKFALPKEQRVPAIEKTAEWEYQVALTLLSKGLGDNDYMLGKQFTAVDILIAHSLFWGMAFKQEIEQENLKEYIGRVGVRPALSAARAKEKNAQS